MRSCGCKVACEEAVAVRWMRRSCGCKVGGEEAVVVRLGEKLWL